MKKLVLLGGGYGNMRVLRELLPHHLPQDWTITLIDKVPYHSLKTEYYALAAGTVSDQDVRVSFPEESKLNVQYGEVTQIDLDEKLVHVAHSEPVSYDQLVIGLGCEDKYHNIPRADLYTH